MLRIVPQPGRLEMIFHGGDEASLRRMRADSLRIYAVRTDTPEGMPPGILRGRELLSVDGYAAYGAV